MSDKIISKRCFKCKEIKPISEFHKEAASRDGFKNDCKICCSKYKKEYSQTEQGKAWWKRYKQSEKGKAARKRYTKSEKRKAAKKRYKQSKKGKATQKRYAQSEKGKNATKCFNIFRPEQIKAVSVVNHAIRDGRLPRSDSLQCHYCPAQAKQYHHYLGYAPEHWLDVVPVCIKCHHNETSKSSIKSGPSLTF